MAGWIWALIWVILVVGALGFFAYLGFDLLAKAKRLLSAGSELTQQATGLANALSATPTQQAFESNLLDEPGPLQAEHRRNLKKRESKRQERQRRLINKLIEYRADESEFKP